MLNLKSGTIITNGLGGPAFNLLSFGPVNLYISPLSFPTVTPEPPEPPEPFVGRPGGVGTAYNDETDLVYKIYLTVNLTKRRTVTKEFIVDKRKKDIIVRRVGRINMWIQEFNTIFTGIKRKITSKWKK